MRAELVWILLCILALIALVGQFISDPINSLLYIIFGQFVVFVVVLMFFIGSMMLGALLYYQVIKLKKFF